MNFLKTVFFFLLFCIVATAQTQFTVQGVFPQGVDKAITLKGFNIVGDTLLDKAIVNKKGAFILKYPAAYVGAAVLEIKEASSVLLLLNKENFELKWPSIEDTRTLQFINSPENTSFLQGLNWYQKSEGKRAGLTYLVEQYKEEPEVLAVLQTELKKQDALLPDFLAGLPATSFAKSYIALRKLITDMPQTANLYPERLPIQESEFKALDFGGPMQNMGIYNDLFTGYFTLLESYGVAEQYKHINPSIDALIANLKNKPALLQEVTQIVFNILEKRSLYPAAEHLALAMLDDTSCQLDTNHKALFEQYRKMARGNIAPDIEFASPIKVFKRLSSMAYKYKLIVFGASWCPKCTEELPKLVPFYEKWKEKDQLEIVFISLDQDKNAFEQFSKGFGWISYSDFKSWDSKVVQDYCVFATPTMYLLDHNNTILAKAITPEHVSVLIEKYNNETQLNVSSDK